MKNDEPLQNYHSFYRFIRSYRGTGHISLSSGKQIDCEFQCGQTEEGDIIVCSHQIVRFLPFIIDGEFDGKSEVRLLGNTSSGQRISANITLFLHLESSSEPSSKQFVSFYATDLTVIEASSAPLYALTYYLVNFEFACPLNWHFAGHEFTIRKIGDYDEAEREMEATKRAKITAKLEIKPDHGCINDISQVDGLANDLCSLLTLAKGCIIGWIHSDGYSSGDLRVRSYHINAVISRYSNFHIILEHDIDDYVRQVFERSEGIKKENIWKFAGSIRHYANTLASESFLELKALNLVSLIEYLVGRFSEHQNTNKIFKDASFDDAKKSALRTDLVDSLIKQFSEEDLVQNDYISEIRKKAKKGTIKMVLNDLAYVTLKGLNRRGFPWSLRRLLDYLRLITSEKEVEIFVKMRNKLVHVARFLNEQDFEEMSIPYENETLQFYRVLSLTSRMLLSILEYRGYYYDWNLKQLSEGVEWVGSTMKARVQMEYR